MLEREWPIAFFVHQPVFRLSEYRFAMLARSRRELLKTRDRVVKDGVHQHFFRFLTWLMSPSLYVRPSEHVRRKHRSPAVSFLRHGPIAHIPALRNDYSRTKRFRFPTNMCGKCRA